MTLTLHSCERAERAAGPYVDVTAITEPVLIWSNEHRAWWRENRCGYTCDVSRAGRYSMAEACRATHHCGPEKQIRIEDAPQIQPDPTARVIRAAPPPHRRALHLAASFALLAAVVFAIVAWFMPAGLDAACREVPVRPVQYSVGW